MNAIEYRCPTCSNRLISKHTPSGSTLQCETCGGVGLNLSVLRRATDELATRVWRHVRQVSKPSVRNCPSCRRPLSEFTIVAYDEELELDACVGCQFIWFDAHEITEIAAQLNQPKLPATLRAPVARPSSDITTPTDRTAGLKEGVVVDAIDVLFDMISMIK